MGFIDWVKQTASNVSNWWNQTAAPAIAKGADWVNQNIVQPVAGVVKDANIPGVSQVAGLAGAAGNVLNNAIQSQYGDKRKFDVGQAVNLGKEVYDQYKKVKSS